MNEADIRTMYEELFRPGDVSGAWHRWVDQQVHDDSERNAAACGKAPLVWRRPEIINDFNTAFDRLIVHTIARHDNHAIVEWEALQRGTNSRVEGVDFLAFRREAPGQKVVDHEGWYEIRPDRSSVHDEGTTLPGAFAVVGASAALERTSERAVEPAGSGWAVEIDAPEWSLKPEFKKGAPWVVIGVGTVAALALVGLWILGASKLANTGVDRTARDVMAVGYVLGVVLLTGIVWKAIASWAADSHLRLSVRRTTAPPGNQADTSRPATPDAQQGKDQSPPSASDTSSPQAASVSTVAKEPVALGVGLVSAGILAVGFAANLSAETMSAIAAGAAAVVGVFVRQVVTPVASPKDAQKKELTPKGS